MEYELKSHLNPLNLIPMEPPVWAPKGHLQTLAGHLIPSKTNLEFGESHQIQLPDGDRLVIYIDRGSKPVVFSQFHGLAGDMNADYMRRGAQIAKKMGFTVVFVNHRGAGPGTGLARSSYHSGRAEDVSEVLKYLKNMFPSQLQIAAGYSMSANILLYLLSGQKGDVKPDAAIAVNAPINLRRASELLKQGLNRLYDRRFVLLLKKAIDERFHQGLISEKYEIPFGSSVWDLDEIYTAKANGFKSREDYYETCSSMPHLHRIETPTYVLTAADDPFVDVQDYLRAKWNPSTQLTISPFGGHLGYYTRKVLPHGNRRWLDHYLEQALQTLVLNLN